MSSIEAFRSSINRFSDFAKASRFWVTIPDPPTGGDTRLLRYRCTDAELPGRSFATFDNRTYGLFQSHPSQTTFGQLNLTFLCSANFAGPVRETGFAEKKIFEDWMDYINPTENSATNITDNALYNFRYKKQYTRDIIVEHYDVVSGSKHGALGGIDNQSDVPTYRVKFIDCFPISINQISLSWASDDNISLIVTFAYTRWQRESSPLNNTITENDSGVITPPSQTASTQEVPGNPFTGAQPFEYVPEANALRQGTTPVR